MLEHRDRCIAGIWTVHLIIMLCIVNLSYAQQLAFPGAEGAGRFTTGGRGGQVIKVTNLDDSGPGSLREAIDASGPRTVVFSVSGNIDLDSPLMIQNDHITIAGQTAPGDGICIRYYNFEVDADNVIIRYVRFRLGDTKKVQADAFGGIANSDIIIDHCSVSWSVDETASFYDNTRFTMQWCLITESLKFSVHAKGAHGYGGIWGGITVSFHHNLLAHHDSRNPRFQGSRWASTPETEIVDYRNNVIYNWGSNSAYGGEAGNHNMVANYYKYGPATSRKDRIISPSDEIGKWYVADNYVFGYPNVTADNWDGGVQGVELSKARADVPFNFEPVITHEAETAFELVMEDAGESRKRDIIDSRIIQEARNGTATYGGLSGKGTGIIDSQKDVGGWPELKTDDIPADYDHDGMADVWESANGLNPNDPEDRNGDFNGDGYTNLEKYMNSLVIRSDYIVAPAEFLARTVSDVRIDLSWKENAQNEVGFYIERSQGDVHNFQVVAETGSDVNGFTDENLSRLTRYTYRVRAFNDDTVSLYTNPATATTLDSGWRSLPRLDPSAIDSSMGERPDPQHNLYSWKLSN